MNIASRWGLSAAAVAALVSFGCDKGEVPRVQVQPVTGKVLARGKPAAGAVLVFVPANSTDPDAIRPRGKVADDGSYVLQTYDPGDGVPPGEYLVSVRWPGPAAQTAPATRAADPDAEGSVMGPPRDYFKGRYADPKRSGLRVTINAGQSELKPIELN